MKPWEDINYQKIQSVSTAKDNLKVVFANSDTVILPIENFILLDTEEYNVEKIEVSDFEVSIAATPTDLIIPWDKIRVMSDPEFAKEMMQKADDNASLVGIRIKTLRERKNIKSTDLAERAGITPQTITRIEKGYTDVNFKTLKKILTAMGYTLKDLASQELEAEESSTEHNLIFVFNKLNEAGIDKSLIKKVLPSKIVETFGKSKKSLPELISNEISLYLNRIFGWSHQEIWGKEPLNVTNSPAALAYFKTPATANLKSIRAYSFYAYYLATLVNNINSEEPEIEYPGDLDEFKFGYFDKYESLDLANLINHIWDMGISVIPLNDSGVFHGASWNINDRHVIVLKQKTSSHARWIFDLLHEVYHVFAHLDQPNSSVIETEEMNPFSNDTPEESEANYFANQFIFGQMCEEVAMEALEKAEFRLEHLKSKVKEVSRSRNIRADFLANYLAFRIQFSGKNWWGTANSFQITSPDPFDVTANILKERIKIDTLNPIDKSQLASALSN